MRDDISRPVINSCSKTLTLLPVGASISGFSDVSLTTQFQLFGDISADGYCYDVLSGMVLIRSGHIGCPQQRTIIEQYGDWNTGPSWVGCYI